MTRVLHYIGSLQFGGSQSFVMELYRKINRDKLQFDFVVFPNENGGIEEEIKALGGKIFVCPRYSGRNHFAFCKWWKAFLAEHPEYHIVHGHVRSSASIYMPIVKKAGRVAIAHSHSTSNGSGFPAMVKALLQFPIRNIADYLFSCSDLAGRWLYGEKATHKPNYRMVPNCIDCQRFSFSEEERTLLRRELGIDDNAFVVGHVGRFHEAKNHEFLVRVFAKLAENHPNSILLLVGDGELRAEIEKQCVSLGITNQTCFVGAQQKTARFYQAMDVFLFPSKWEGLPMSVVEAQASGLPCLVSDTVTRDVKLTDLVSYYSLEKTEDVWSDALLEYVGLERRAVTMEQKRKLERFDSTRVAEEMQKFYLSL